MGVILINALIIKHPDFFEKTELVYLKNESQVTPWIALLAAPDGMLNHMRNREMKCEVNDINPGCFTTQAGPGGFDKD